MNQKLKTGLYIGGGILTLITGYVAYKKISNKAKLNRDTKAVAKGDIKQLGINIPEIAAQIGVDMGYAFPAYDPRRWTENDTAVKESVLKVPKPLIPILINEYYKKYKRNLKDDLQSRLDDYAAVQYLFT